MLYVRNRSVTHVHCLSVTFPVPGIQHRQENIQGCGNTMPNLVPFDSGQVENFYLLVLGQVQMFIANTILLSYFD